jgi:hypothetical protein
MDELLKRLLTVDTLINVGVFVFIGLMVWLYFKGDKNGDSEKRVE